MLLNIGTILGDRYEIISKIGSGGMAVVYRGRDRKLERYVSIKVLREEFIGDEEFMGRFESEACSVAKLSHPNIVRVYDVGQEGDVNYIVMEYIHGNTLKKAIKEKAPFDTNSTLNVAIQIASALAQAHKNQIIHRDIKPQNILVSTDGVAKVTDFGIARAASASTVTTTANAAGSVHYFSPEQARGGYVDEKSDIYSLGITMYEMITGEMPFQGSNSVSIALKHIGEEVPEICLYNPNCSQVLEGIIKKAIMKKADERYENIELMLADLVQARRDDGNVPTVSEKPTTNPQKNKRGDRVVDTAMSYISGRNKNKVAHLKDEPAEPTYEPVKPNKPKRFEGGEGVLDEEVAKANFLGKELEGETTILKNGEDYRPKREQKDIQTQSRRIVNEVKENFDKYDKKIHISKGDDYEEEYVDLPQMENPMKRGRQNNMTNSNNNNRDKDKQQQRQNSRIKAREQEKQKKKMITILVAVITSVTIIGGMCVGFLRMVNSGKFDIIEEYTYIQMPSLIGLELADATTPADDVGLILEVVGEDFDAYYGKGIIIKQEFQAGEDVLEGTTVGITISKGLETLKMPSLLNKTEDEALEVLENLMGVMPSVTYQYNDNMEAGLVAEQSPESGDPVDASTNIKIVISRGEQNNDVYVPNVVGRTEDQATSDIKAVGLKVGSISRVESDTVTAGKVITQTVRSGSQVAPNTVVNIVVSLGKAEVEVEEEDEDLEDETNNDETDTDLDTEVNDETDENNEDSNENNSENNSENEENSSDQDGMTDEELENFLDDLIEDYDASLDFAPENIEPDEEPEEEVEDEEETTETLAQAQKSFQIQLPEGAGDEVYVRVTCDDADGFYPDVDEMKSSDNFPYTVTISGRGQGTVNCYIDGALQWSQTVTFN